MEVESKKVEANSGLQRIWKTKKWWLWEARDLAKIRVALVGGWKPGKRRRGSGRKDPEDTKINHRESSVWRTGKVLTLVDRLEGTNIFTLGRRTNSGDCEGKWAALLVLLGP
jgi:hypothetical protein